MPVKNGAEYLPECLDSILNQTHRPIEVIVVDDGSTDESAEIAEGYGPSVKLVRQPSRGLIWARCTGIEHARGAFVAHLDADDIWSPAKLETQLARFAVRPELQVSITHFVNFWIPELAEEAARYAGHPLSEPIAAFSPCTVLARRSLFDDVPLDPDEGIGGDTLWFLRVQESGAAYELLPEVLMSRRFHRSNVTRTQTSDYLQAFMQVTKARLDLKRRERNKAQPD